MNIQDKTKQELINEVESLHRKMADHEILEKEHRRVKSLYTIAQTVNQTLDLQEMLDRAVKKTVQITGAHIGMVYIFDAERKKLQLKATTGISPEMTKQIASVSLTDEEIDRIAGSKADAVDTASINAAFSTDYIADLLQPDGDHSFFTAPVIGIGQICGILVVARNSRCKFNPAERELVTSIGKQIGLGIENARLFHELSMLTTIDTLTGLHNSQYFQERLDEEVERSSRYGQECSIILLEIDHFTMYNDFFGYTSGDQTIKKMAELIKKSIRKMDIGCRYNGPSFAVILPATQSAIAFDVAERLRQKIETSLLEDNNISSAMLTISAGVSSFPVDGPSAEGLIRKAEIALVEARQRGGSQTNLASDLLRKSRGKKRTIWEVAEYLESANVNSIFAMATALDARDHYSAFHSRNVSRYAVLIGKALDIKAKNLDDLRTAALLHDIGKIGVSDMIICKSGPLDTEEWNIMMKHAELGANIVSHIPELSSCTAAIRHHHERFDGTGYPDKIKGKAISLEARIIAVAEAYDTMTTDRTYRKAMTHADAAKELKRCSLSQFDPVVVLTFIHELEKNTQSRTNKQTR
jgi:diguanylate cyclase (GGDEF)-like protein/putative nucleotidyltransferase with HDIG domain